jgi:O-antigen ligase
LLVLLWVLMLVEPQWWLASYGLSPLLRLPTVLLVVMAAVLLFGVPSKPVWNQRWQWYVPFLSFIVTGSFAIPFALNNGRVRDELTAHVLFWVLIVSTATFVRSVRKAEQLLLICGIQYLWWGLWGARNGRVFWHTTMSNYDAFGSVMLSGIGVCYFFALAADKRWFRWAMYGGVAISAVGVIASFARGAFLGAVGLYAAVLVRSQHKLKTLGLGVVTALTMMAAIAALYPETFWAEIQSTFTEGTTEGTGEDRWELWKTGVAVFQERPLMGVGARNFGPFSAQFFDESEVGGMYALNTGALYERNLHNEYLRFLSERGIIGFAIFLWILLDFFRRNAALRSAEAVERWRAGGGRMDLRNLSLGIEASMIAWMITATLYPVSSITWLFSVLAFNLLLHNLVVRGHPPTARHPAAKPPSGGRMLADAASAPAGRGRLHGPRG